MESQYEKKIEDLMQQNYQLKSLVEEYKSKEDWYKEEISQLEEATSRNDSKKRDRAKEIELKEKINSLRLELESAQQGEKIQHERITLLEQIVEENQQQLNPELSGTKTDCDETMGISREEQFAELHEEIAALKAQRRTDKTDTLALKLEVDTLKHTLATNEEELVSVQIECSSYCNLLEKARTENLELKTQMDVLVMQHEQLSHKTKGNSLFSEIDDRRIEAEKVLVSQQNTYDTMKKKTELLKGQNKDLQMQLFAVLGKGSDESDRVGTLEVQLEQERSERKVLMDKIKKLEEYQANEKITERLSEFSQKVTTGDKGVDKDYIEYLVNMVKSKEEDIQELSRQLHIQGMCLLDQKNKVTEKEKLLYSVGVKKDELFRTCQQLKMEKAELELELKPELKRKAVGKTERIPTRGVDETNVSVLRVDTSENKHRGADRQWALNMMKKWEEEDKVNKETKTKAVSISDDVDVIEADGQSNTTVLRNDENDRKLVREKHSQGRVKICTKYASEPKYKVDDCNTQ